MHVAAQGTVGRSGLFGLRTINNSYVPDGTGRDWVSCGDFGFRGGRLAAPAEDWLRNGCRSPAPRVSKKMPRTNPRLSPAVRSRSVPQLSPAASSSPKLRPGLLERWRREAAAQDSVDSVSRRLAPRLPEAMLEAGVPEESYMDMHALEAREAAEVRKAALFRVPARGAGNKYRFFAEEIPRFREMVTAPRSENASPEPERTSEAAAREKYLFHSEPHVREDKYHLDPLHSTFHSESAARTDGFNFERQRRRRQGADLERYEGAIVLASSGGLGGTKGKGITSSASLL